MRPQESQPAQSAFRRWIHEVIFGADTPLGKAFDVVLIVSIILSVIAVLLDSVAEVEAEYGAALHAAEWFFTILFTIEYLLRLYCLQKPGIYARSFFGIVDLLAILPTYISLLIPGGQYLLVVRLLRVLRIFRVLKIVQYISEADILVEALRASQRKITVFLFAVLTVTVIVGALMYMIEGPEHGYRSIPEGVYWAIVTLTTVGYGDISPQTVLGRVVASLVMVLGYGVIAVPTGIVSVELANARSRIPTANSCPTCGADGHQTDARYCRICGQTMNPEREVEGG